MSGLSTIFREDGDGSPFSSRRVYAGVCMACFVACLGAGLVVLFALRASGWYAALAFAPAVLCLFGAIVFSYFASIKDFAQTVELVQDAAEVVNGFTPDKG
jgi:hypothetical protein